MDSHSTTTTDWQSKILKKEYQNWLAVGHALSLMCDGLRPYIDREMKAFHQALLANLRFASPCTCPTSFPKHSFSCAWAAQLAMYHRGSPKWHQSDPYIWTDPNQGYWEVAKLFMPDLGTSKSTVVDAASTDCTGLINLLFWCNYFRIQKFLAKAVRETRNTKWGHAARQELTDIEKADALTAIKNLLQDTELAADTDAVSALAEIDKMEKDFDARSVERKVQADFRVEVGCKLSAIEDEMNDLNTASNKAIKELQNQQKKVLEIVKNRSCAIKALSFLWWTLTKMKTRFFQSMSSLNTRYLSLWIVTLIFMGVIGYLNHNSFKDGSADTVLQKAVASQLVYDEGLTLMRRAAHESQGLPIHILRRIKKTYLFQTVSVYYFSGCPWEDTNVSFHTKEYNFTSVLETNRAGFTGRDWLFQDILKSLLQNTRDDNPVRGVLVVGEPGTGKSALTAQLICSRSSNAFIHRKIIGYHLCRFSDKATQDPGRFVRNLVDLIARRIPEYELLVSSSSSVLEILSRRCLQDPYECFEQAIVAPLQRLGDAYQDHFIVVDALDECASDPDDGGPSIVHFIKESFKRLPEWIKLIATSRNDSMVLRHLSATPKVHLSSTDVRNVQDIEIFATTKLVQEAPFIDRLQVMLGLSNGKGISYLTNLLLNQSEGNFLLMKEIVHFWTEHLHDDADFNKLPKTIDDTYEGYFRREFGSREKFKSALPMLEVLVAVFEPMQISRVFEVIKIREALDYDYEYHFVYTVQRLSHFIRYETDNTITVFHPSFIKWLISRENVGKAFYVSQRHGHRRLAEYYFSVMKKAPNSSMDIYRLAQHLSFLDIQGDDRDYLKEFRNINSSFINAAIDKDNRTLLHLAAANNSRMVLEIVAGAFGNIDCEDNYGFTPGFLAAMRGLSKNVEFLISRGANIEYRTKPPHSPPILLLQSIQQSKLIAYSNSTMLHAAALGGHINVVRSLLKKNVSFGDSNGVNLTAIQLAAVNGHLNVVVLLYKSGAPVDHTLLQLADAGGHANVVKFVLETGVIDNRRGCNTYLTVPTSYRSEGRRGSGGVSESDNRLSILFLILYQTALYFLAS